MDECGRYAIKEAWYSHFFFKSSPFNSVSLSLPSAFLFYTFNSRACILMNIDITFTVPLATDPFAHVDGASGK